MNLPQPFSIVGIWVPIAAFDIFNSQCKKIWIKSKTFARAFEESDIAQPSFLHIERNKKKYK